LATICRFGGLGAETQSGKLQHAVAEMICVTPIRLFVILFQLLAISKFWHLSVNLLSSECLTATP